MLKTFKNIILILSLLFLSSCSAISVSHYKNQGVDFLNDGYYEDAIDSFDRALLLSDGAVGRMQFDILLYKAEGLFLIGEYEKANHIYDSLLKIDNKNKVYEELFNKSKAYIKVIELKDALNKDDVELSRKLIDEIKQLGLGTDRAVEFNEAVYLERSGQWEEAKNAFADYFIKYSSDKIAEKELEFLNTRVTSKNRSRNN